MLRRAWQAARQEMSAPALAPRNCTAERSYTCIRYLITPAVDTTMGQPWPRNGHQELTLAGCTSAVHPEDAQEDCTDS